MFFRDVVHAALIRYYCHHLHLIEILDRDHYAFSGITRRLFFDEDEHDGERVAVVKNEHEGAVASSIAVAAAAAAASNHDFQELDLSSLRRLSLAHLDYKVNDNLVRFFFCYDRFLLQNKHQPRIPKSKRPLIELSEIILVHVSKKEKIK